MKKGGECEGQREGRTRGVNRRPKKKKEKTADADDADADGEKKKRTKKWFELFANKSNRVSFSLLFIVTEVSRTKS